MAHEWTIANPESYAPVFESLLQACPRKVVLLYGDLGVGKTTFVKAFCRYLGVEDEADSPTFSLVNRYRRTGGQGFVYHLDLYRLQTVEEVLDLGYYEMVDSGDWVFVEWPELLAPLLDGDECKIKLEVRPDFQRKLILL